MRYCLIGCGRVSPEHIRAAKQNNLEIVGLCDINKENFRENLRSFQLDDIPFYEDYKTMLRCAAPELCAIATPSGLHAQMTLACLEAGAHVIVEKPIAMNMDDARAIEQAAKRTGLTVCNNLQNRFNPAVQALRKAVDAGRFGKIYNATLQLRWYRGADYYSSAAWRGTKALDGGAMMNQSIHGIDLINWMLGSKPERITAFTTRAAHEIECEDLGIAAIQYPSALVSLECTTAWYPRAQQEVIEINGKKGCVRLGGNSGQVVEIWRFDDATEGEEEDMRQQYSVNPKSVYGHGHSMLYADVLSAIAEKRPPLSDIKAGMGALAIVLGAYESAATDRPFTAFS